MKNLLEKIFNSLKVLYNEEGKRGSIMNGRYKALDLAETVVALADKKGMYISNLQLQKVLYYIQGEFMKQFSEKAFNEKINCWPYGPAIKDVWSVYNVFGRNPIRGCNSKIHLKNEEENIIVKVLKSKLKMNVWDMVDETHEELPWSNASKLKLPYLKDSDMKKFFCE